MDYEEFLTGVAVDLVAISVLTCALHFRRHQRRDLPLGFMGTNVGLFAAERLRIERPAEHDVAAGAVDNPPPEERER